MGEVYRARDTRLGRDVAVKVLPTHLSSNSELKLRLEREAKAISSLNHPHICTLHDVGSQDGMDFLAGGGAKWQVSKDGGTSPKWRRDTKELFYLDGSDNIVAVDVAASGDAVNLGVPHILFQSVGIQRDYGAYDVSADGKKFLINSGNLAQGGDPLTLVQNWTAELKK